MVMYERKYCPQVVVVEVPDLIKDQVSHELNEVLFFKQIQIKPQ
jgi:hypothetical protein